MSSYAYLSSILGNQKLTFGIGLIQGFGTPKRLNVTYSTTWYKHSGLTVIKLSGSGATVQDLVSIRGSRVSWFRVLGVGVDFERLGFRFEVWDVYTVVLVLQADVDCRCKDV